MPWPKEVLAREDLQQFWLNLPEATEEGGFLDLKQGTFFMGEQSKGSSLLVRKSYIELMEVLMDLVKQGTTNIVITGSPGIGKSVSIFYLMYRLVTDSPGKLPVIVLMAWGCPAFCFEGGSVKQGAPETFTTQLDDPGTWLLADGMAPVLRAAKTLVFSSPNRDNYHAFLKRPMSTLRFMPAWSLEELEQCRSRLYKDRLTVEEMWRLYDRWGGRPRYVLEKALDDVQQEELVKIAYSCDLAALLRRCSWGEHRSEDYASDSLLEIRVEDDYITTTVGFASSFVADTIAGRLLSLKQAAARYPIASEVMPDIAIILDGKWPARPVRQLALKVELSSLVKRGKRPQIMRPLVKFHVVGRQLACTPALRPF